MTTKFNILVKAEDLVNYIFLISDKAPRKYRLDLSAQLRLKCLIILEELTKANSFALDKTTATPETVVNRKQHQEEALLNIRVLESFLNVAYKNQCILMKQLTHSTQLSQELFDMIQNWIVSDKRRIQQLSQ